MIKNGWEATGQKITKRNMGRASSEGVNQHSCKKADQKVKASDAHIIISLHHVEFHSVQQLSTASINAW